MLTFTKTRTWLLLCALFVLPGCLQEDSIAITNDGLVSFESVVTEPDAQNRMTFPALEKVVTSAVNELRQHQWTVEQKWTSKKRPYGLTVTASGKLPEVVGTTAFYNLRKVNDKTYQVSFLPGLDGTVRVAFKSSQGSAVIADAAGKPVHDIESALATEKYTITLK